VSEDDDNENNSKYFFLTVSYPKGSIVINEFMYVPKSDWGGEWIELLNISGDTVNLRNWTIADNSTRALMTDADYFVPPGSYVVIASDSVLLEYWDVGEYFIKSKVKLPALNDAGDSIVVRDLCGQTIDALKYSSAWGKKPGVSLERINPYIDDQNSSNWSLSGAAEGGTPGKRNSVMVKNYDLAMDSLIILTPNIIIGDSVTVKSIVRNRGLNTAFGYLTRFTLLDADKNAVFDSIVVVNDSLEPGKEQTSRLDIVPENGGIFQVLAVVIYEKDEDVYNDSNTCFLAIGYPENSLIINEIMYMPETGETEWFEIFNPSSIEVNLNRWRFRDAGGGWRTLTTETEIITTNGFCIVAAKQDFRQAYPQFSGSLIVPDSFPILNNSSDSLFLADGSDRVIETVCFRQEWGGATGISIERKDPNAPALNEFNWGSSSNPAGATPGMENSILKYQYDLKILPGSFLFVDSTVALIRPVSFQIGIINSGSQESSRFSLEVYYDVNGDNKASPGELVWSLHNIPPLLPDSTILLDGEIYSEKSGRCHYLAIVAMSDDENTKDNMATTDLLVAYPIQSVVVNEFFAYPNSGQAEFIELVHRGGDIINLNEWRLEDSRSAIVLSHPIMLEKGKYLVLAQDSSFFDYCSVSNFQVIIPEKWPGLSNTADKIVIRDLTGTIIDSLAYNSEWGVVSGVSLEKRLPEDPSEQRQFWSRSQDASGSTPGADNSIMPRLFDLKLDSILVSWYDGNIETEVDIMCWFSNRGQNSCASAKISVQENRQTIAIKNIGEIAPGGQDSVTMNIGTFESGIHRLQVFVDWAEDMNPGNDTLSAEIRTAYPEGKLLLSEFMAIPRVVITESGSNSEYIEIFNPSEEIQLEGWMICDENTGAPVEIQEQKTISSGGYFVFAADSSVFHFTGVISPRTVVFKKFPTLNNTADALYLKDPTGKTIDSLIYNSQWTVPQYISMERVYFSNPNTISNWRYSTDPSGGTPGYKNSVAIDDATNRPGIKTSPNPFSPNGDGVDDEVAIMYQLPFPSARVTVQIYDLMGRLIYEPARNITTSSRGAVYWDGSGKHGNRARIGMYLVRCSATDAASDKTVGYITTIVLVR
ncbi:MAG: lamin tail domain-containing protein, partial [Candidatus Marinimicrobia bacterium]|nr:lamin tail domain-containing protein [Candidatus Neomarinimicrobiota bacterium]